MTMALLVYSTVEERLREALAALKKASPTITFFLSGVRQYYGGRGGRL